MRLTPYSYFIALEVVIIATAGRGAKNKGSAYELKMAKSLSAWWGEDFHRTPNSGAWSSTHNSDMQAGDIITPEKAKFPFVVECKNHEGWTLENVIMNTGNHRDWYEQVVGDALRVKKVPFLLFHRNFSDDFVTLPYSAHVEAKFKSTNNYYAKHQLVKYNKMLGIDKTFDVITVGLAEFIKLYSPEELKKGHKRIFKGWYDILKGEE